MFFVGQNRFFFIFISPVEAKKFVIDVNYPTETNGACVLQ